MAKSIDPTAKKRGRGRPSLGSSQINISVPAALRSRIDAWANAQPGPELSSSMVARRLIELALVDPLPAGLSRRVDVYAKHMNMSRAQAIATLLDLALGEDKAKR